MGGRGRIMGMRAEGKLSHVDVMKLVVYILAGEVFGFGIGWEGLWRTICQSLLFVYTLY
jgi:hypothetical protein